MVRVISDSDNKESKNMSDEEDSDEDDEDYVGEDMDDDDGDDGDENADEEDEDDEDSDEDDDAELYNEVKTIQDHLLDNPFDYDQHLKLIEVATKLGELPLLRKAWENMSSKFPLTPSLWLEWINNEKRLVDGDEDEKHIIQLFERALKDYVSVDLWYEYILTVAIPVTIGSPACDQIRDVFERAISSVGLDVNEGSKVWTAYRTYECTIAGLEENKSGLVDQLKRIFELYKRQLAIPLLAAPTEDEEEDKDPMNDLESRLTGMEQSLQEFHSWCEQTKAQCPELDIDSESVKYAYDQAHALLLKLYPYEQELIKSEPPHYQEYLKYIEFEETHGTPPRVQCIYERSLLENWSQPELWINYTRYFDTKVQDLSLVTSIHERAVRNCPWTVSIWINYLRSLERNKAENDTILRVFQRSIEMTFQTGKDYLDLWLTYLDCLRRRTNWNEESQVSQLRKNFASAIEHLSSFADGDESCTVPLYMAKIEAKYIKNMGEARRIWNELFQSRKDLGASEATWIEYANFEKLYGDDAHYRKVLIKGLNSPNIQYPETLGALLIKHVREESESITETDEVTKIYEKAIVKVTKRREDAAKKAQETKSKFKAADKGARKRQVQEQEPSVFKVPQVPGSSKKASDESKGKHRMSTNAVKDEKVLAEMKRQAEYKDKDDERQLNTIVVKNLKYSVLEDKLKEVFSQFGEIVDIRLVRNYKGLSAGYGYIEFKEIRSVKEALKHDRLSIEGRPCFIDECGKKFKPEFSTSRENNKLFVSNLDKQVTTEQLTKIFEKHGKLKDVRIITLKNGKPKGYAYVEYRSEKEANEALKANGMLVLDKEIKVQISDPSARNNRDNKVLGSGLLQSSTSGISAKRRINVPLIPLSVRKKFKMDEKIAPLSSPAAANDSAKKSNDGDGMDTSLPSTSKA